MKIQLEANGEKKKMVFAIKKSQEPGLISIQKESVPSNSTPDDNVPNKNPKPVNRRGGGGPKRGGQKYMAKQPGEAKAGEISILFFDTILLYVLIDSKCLNSFERSHLK